MARLLQFSLAILTLLLLFNFCSLAAAQESGTAAFHDSDKLVPSACYGNEDYGPLVAGVKKDLFNNGTICGHVYELTYDGKSIDVAIVDECADQGKDKCETFVLTKHAFAQLADPFMGVIDVSYKQVL